MGQIEGKLLMHNSNIAINILFCVRVHRRRSYQRYIQEQLNYYLAFAEKQSNTKK